MNFRDYTVADVQQKLGLELRDAEIFTATAEVPVRPDFSASIAYGVELATSIDSEKARSEFIIAPVLMELRRNTGDRFKLFSGVDWSVDPSRGLNGYCDYLLTRGPSQLFVSAPYLAVAEAKNDHIAGGLGQCISAMFAAQVGNADTTQPIYGVVTNGLLWRFLRLIGNNVEIERENVSISDLPRLMGVLTRIVEGT